MAVYTYVTNTNVYDGNASIELRGGTLFFAIGTYADLTTQEIAQIRASGRYQIAAGIIGNAIPATSTNPGDVSFPANSSLPILVTALNAVEASESANDVVLGSDDALGGPGGTPLTSSVGTGSPPSPSWMLIQWTLTSAFTITSATRDGNEAITTASVTWPDGATGTFTTDTASSSFPGAIDAYHVTYVYNPGSGNVTKTITQAAVTRDSSGAVTAQPTPTVA